MNTTRKDGFSILGLGAAACVACCAGPLLAVLGGLSIAGLAGTLLIGSGGLLIAAGAAAGFLLVRRRRRSACTVAPDDSVPVQFTARQGASR